MLSSPSRQFSALALGVYFTLNASALADPPVSAEGKKGSKPSGTVSILGGKTVDVSKPYGYHLQPLLDRIKANPDQRSKIKVIVESYRAKIQPLRDEYKQKQQEFLASMTSGNSAETIMTRQVELSHLSSEITSRYTLMRLEIRRQLSPEQLLQFESYAREHGWNRR